MPAPDWPEAEQRIAEVARTRRGRHRDRALASWRRTRAIELRASGMSYEGIAREVGYTSKATAFNVVQTALVAREAETVDMHRRLQMDRLEALHAALWPRAKLGHLPSVHGVLSVMQQQLRLLGINPTHRRKRPEDAWPSCVGPATVVAHPLDCRHEGCERHGSFADLRGSVITEQPG